MTFGLSSSFLLGMKGNSGAVSPGSTKLTVQLGFSHLLRLAAFLVCESQEI